MRWQVPHSKVRSSKPRSPGEIRANPILCLQVRHIGRSTMDDIRIAQLPLKPYVFQQSSVCPVPDSRPKFGRSINTLRNRVGTFDFGLQALSGTWPAWPSALKAPIPPGGGRASEGTSTALSPRTLGCAAGVMWVVTGNRQKRRVRFVSLLKPTGDPVRSASAPRQGISCTIGGKSG